MLIIDRTQYTHIRWRWRVFNGDSFLGYVQATGDEVAKIAATLLCVVDLERGSLELL